MKQPETAHSVRLSPISLAIIIVALAVAAAFSIVPEITKPIFMKYYRTMYSAEVVRPS